VQIRYLGRQGLSKTQIARRLGVDRKTVRKYLRPETVENLVNQLYASLADGAFIREMERHAKADLVILDELGSSPATGRSRNGPASSMTPSSSPPYWTGSCITPTCST